MNFGSQTGCGLASLHGSPARPESGEAGVPIVLHDPSLVCLVVPGGALILLAAWYKVELDVRINEWFGDFYNLIQKALGKPGSITMDEYLGQLATFGRIAGLYVLIAVGTDFFIKHYVFRWRAAMNEFYTAHWQPCAASRAHPSACRKIRCASRG
jgi:ABC-type long-subunit fatty acid transport system fused permease/ATPase subunit